MRDCLREAMLRLNSPRSLVRAASLFALSGSCESGNDYGSIALASCLHSGASELSGAGIECGGHRCLGLRALHLVQKIVEFGAKAVETTGAPFQYRLEHLRREQHRL